MLNINPFVPRHFDKGVFLSRASKDDLNSTMKIKLSAVLEDSRDFGEFFTKKP